MLKPIVLSLTALGFLNLLSFQAFADPIPTCNPHVLSAEGTISQSFVVKPGGGFQLLPGLPVWGAKAQTIPANVTIAVQSDTDTAWGYSAGYDFVLAHDLSFTWIDQKKPSMQDMLTLTVNTFDNSNKITQQTETLPDGTVHFTETALVLGSHMQEKQNFDLQIKYDSYSTCSQPNVNLDSCLKTVFNYTVLPNDGSPGIVLPEMTCDYSG